MQLIPSSPEAIRISGLKKSFGQLAVLGGVDVSFRGGEITAVIGPNGAGKTTLIKCLLGLVKPDAGSLEVAGSDVSGSVDYRRHIGYMPQHPSFPENLTGRDFVALVSSLRPSGIETDRSLERILGLGGEMDKPFRTLSGGTKQKISALIAFLFRPSVLILDEPTAGLDPVASAALKDSIVKAAAQGVTVLMTSHVVADLEELCDRVVFLLDGKVRFDGTLESIRRQTGEHRLERAVANLLKRQVA